MICLYEEMEKGQFWICRQYVGHTADISALAGYSNGIVSGSVNGEIILWVIESANHQGRSRLPGGIAVDCMVCLDSHLFIGDADGFVHIFLMPKLAPLQSILGHGLVVRHSLSAMGLDEFNSILYTGDTFGYVKQWRIDRSNGIALEETKIGRFHGEEITSIVVVNNGAFIATVGADRCLRLWKSQSFEYVAVFTVNSHWNIDDMSTYDMKPPYDLEYEHFGLQKTEIPQIKSMITGSLPDLLFSSRQLLEERPRSVLVDRGSDEPEEPAGTMELSEMRKVLDEFMADASHGQTADSDIFKEMKERDTLREPIPRPRLLQMSTRPQDLIENLTDIYRTEQGVERTVVVPTSTKRVLVIPMAAIQRQKLTNSPVRRAIAGSGAD
jgi:hypothetical protein